MRATCSVPLILLHLIALIAGKRQIMKTDEELVFTWGLHDSIFNESRTEKPLQKNWEVQRLLKKYNLFALTECTVYIAAYRPVAKR
jgi:hypothetical protein